MHRRALLAGLAASAAFGSRAHAADPAPDALGFRPDPVFLEEAKALLSIHAAIDIHGHPGLLPPRGGGGGI